MTALPCDESLALIDRSIAFSPSHAAQQQTQSGTGTDSRDKLMKELVRQRPSPTRTLVTAGELFHGWCIASAFVSFAAAAAVAAAAAAAESVKEKTGDRWQTMKKKSH